jgi:hypothetical protein
MGEETRKSHNNKIGKTNFNDGSQADSHTKMQSFTEVSVAEPRLHFASPLV